MSTRRVWFTSDQHYGHKNIIKHSGRPFSSVEEMDAALIANHNEVVHHDDTVYHLGDFAWHDKKVEHYLSQLRGQHYLVPGNHDECHSCHRQYRKGCTAYTFAGFQILDEQAVISLGGALGMVLMCHMPAWDGQDQRYPEHRPRVIPDRFLLHGHVHERWQTRKVSWGWQINVGVDVWKYGPVMLEQLQHLAAVLA